MEKVLDKIAELLRDVARDGRLFINALPVKPEQITRGETGGGPSLDLDMDEDPQ